MYCLRARSVFLLLVVLKVMIALDSFFEHRIVCITLPFPLAPLSLVV